MNIRAYFAKRRFDRSLRIAQRKFRQIVESSHYTKLCRQERRNLWRSFWRVFRGPQIERLEAKPIKKR